MPPTVEAAAATDAYRAWLVGLVDALRRRAAADMTGIDFDNPDRWLRDWLAVYTPIVDGAVQGAASRAVAYLSAYLAAAGVERVYGVPSIDTSHVPGELDRARVGALWRLGRGDGRTAARVTAGAMLERIASSVVYDAARAAQHSAMAGEDAIVGYRRVTSSRPCGACLGISGRLERRQDVIDRHDRCSCTGEPVIRGVPERVSRPTGQERVDGMSDAELAGLFAGRGGEQKAAAVRSQGVSVLVDHVGGQLVESPLQTIVGP